MLPKNNRFTTQLFQLVFPKTKKMRTKNGLFLYARAKSNPKFSVVVSKKITKKAVERNKLRRQIYTLFRTQLVPFVHDKHVIFLYKGTPVLHNAAELNADIQAFLDSFPPQK